MNASDSNLAETEELRAGAASQGADLNEVDDPIADKRQPYCGARKGKIARLPRAIRDELNQRLEDGEEGGRLLDWLNAKPEVRKILEDQFAGVPISKQNLSEWRQGGFREWQAKEALLDEAGNLTDFTSELDNTTDSDFIADHLAKVVALRYAALLRSWNGQWNPKFEAELRILQRISQDVLQLQKGIHRGSRFNAEWHQRLEKERADSEARHKERILGPIWAMMRKGTLIQALGGGKTAEKLADIINAVHYNLPFPEDDAADKAGQTKSNQVKPDLGADKGNEGSEQKLMKETKK